MSDEIETPEDENVVNMTDHSQSREAAAEAISELADAAASEEGAQVEGEETLETMAGRLIAIEAEKLEIKDQLLRTLADMENLRKRTQRQLADERVYAVEKFAGDMLGVADNLARALTALTAEARADLSDAGKSLLEGIELTEKELIVSLSRHGVKAVDSTAGTEFDPNVHQAVAQIPSDQPEGTVAEPFQTGWKLGERTLRAAMVAVSTGSGE
ncbi:MAG: nucleotide exchange factor GrpE [Hyphomonadaceae bacterium]